MVVAKVVEGAPTRDRDRTDNSVDVAKKIVAKYKRVRLAYHSTYLL